MIYLDNAATTMHKPEAVIEAVAEAMRTMGNASRGAHGGSLAAGRIDLHAREQVADLFGCPNVDHVVFTCNSTEALNIALMGLLEEGDHVISTDLEHNSVLRPLYRLEAERGVELDFVGCDALGRPDYEGFERLLRPNTRMVVCNHASNVTGNLVDAGRIGAFAKERGLLFVLDASQTAGSIPIDMGSLGADVICFTGHKGLFGPQGTGGMCIAEGVEIRPWKVGGTGVQSFSREQPSDYPTRLEAGTLNSHGLAGLSAALSFVAETGVEAIGARERELMWRFFDQVSAIDGVSFYGDVTLCERPERAAIVALNIRDYDSAAVSDELFSRYGIATRPGAHCAPRMHEALGTSGRGIVRFSFSYFNTKGEVDAAASAVRQIAC
jgi:cysteine desulfurase family protein